MSRYLQDDQHYSQRLYVGNKKRYGFFNFAFDCVMTMVTSGFWLIWVFAREMRRR